MKAGKSVRVPSYRLHRPSGRAVVTLGGRDHYLGRVTGEPRRHGQCPRLCGEGVLPGENHLVRYDHQADYSHEPLCVSMFRHL